MNAIEQKICESVESLSSNEIESLISELQMIADRKYQEEEDTKIYQEAIESYNKEHESKTII